MAKANGKQGGNLPVSQGPGGGPGNVAKYWGETIEAIMAGRLTVEQLPEIDQGGIKHLLLLPIYNRAVKVLEYQSRDQRRAALDRLPASIRGAVEVEARRVFEYRQGLRG